MIGVPPITVNWLDRGKRPGSRRARAGASHAAEPRRCPDPASGGDFITWTTACSARSGPSYPRCSDLSACALAICASRVSCPLAPMGHNSNSKPTTVRQCLVDIRRVMKRHLTLSAQLDFVTARSDGNAGHLSVQFAAEQWRHSSPAARPRRPSRWRARRPTTPTGACSSTDAIRKIFSDEADANNDARRAAGRLSRRWRARQRRPSASCVQCQRPYHQLP